MSMAALTSRTANIGIIPVLKPIRAHQANTARVHGVLRAVDNRQEGSGTPNTRNDDQPAAERYSHESSSRFRDSGSTQDTSGRDNARRYEFEDGTDDGYSQKWANENRDAQPSNRFDQFRGRNFQFDASSPPVFSRNDFTLFGIALFVVVYIGPYIAEHPAVLVPPAFLFFLTPVGPYLTKRASNMSPAISPLQRSTRTVRRDNFVASQRPHRSPSRVDRSSPGPWYDADTSAQPTEYRTPDDSPSSDEVRTPRVEVIQPGKFIEYRRHKRQAARAWNDKHAGSRSATKGPWTVAAQREQKGAVRIVRGPGQDGARGTAPVRRMTVAQVSRSGMAPRTTTSSMVPGFLRPFLNMRNQRRVQDTIQATKRPLRRIVFTFLPWLKDWGGFL